MESIWKKTYERKRGKKAVIVSQLPEEKRMTGNNRNVIIFP